MDSASLRNWIGRSGVSIARLHMIIGSPETTRKKAQSIIHGLTLGLAMIFYESGCTSPESIQYDLVKQINTPQAYVDFLQRYPKISRKKRIEKFLQQSTWQQAKSIDTVPAYIDFYLQYPESPNAHEAIDLAFKAAARSEFPSEIYYFLIAFPSYQQNVVLRKRLEGIEFELAKKQVDPLAMDIYLKNFPRSEHQDEAARLLVEKSYQQIKQWDNALGYRVFMRQFPKSPYDSKVKTRLAQLMQTPPPEAMARSGPTKDLLREAREKSRFIEQYECALILAQMIQTSPNEKSFVIDILRNDLHSIFSIESTKPSSPSVFLRPFAGIGARIAWDEGGWPVIHSVTDGLPAARAGLMAGDRISRINDQPTKNMGGMGLLTSLRGDPGSSVQIVVESENRSHTHSLKREQIGSQTASSPAGSEKDSDLPFNCLKPATFDVLPQDRSALAKAVDALLKVQEEQIQLAKLWKENRQAEETIEKLTVKAHAELERFETNELTEEVLGGGFTPGLSTGEVDKPLINTKDAIPRLERGEGLVKKTSEELGRLLQQLDGAAKALSRYIVSLERISHDK